MEAALEGDDLERSVLMQGAIFARELDRAFIGFSAGTGEEHLVKAALIDKRLRELEASGVVVRGARRNQEFCLRRKGLRQAGRRVTETVHRPALDEIEIALARIVPEVGAFASDEHGLGTRGEVHQGVEWMGSLEHGGLLWGLRERQVENARRPRFLGRGLLENLS